MSPLAVNRASENVHDSAQQRLADGHAEQFARGSPLVALVEVRRVAEHDAAYFVFAQVERDSENAVLEAYHFVVHGFAQTVQTRHAVGDCYNLADVALAVLALDFLDARAYLVKYLIHLFL